MAVLTISGDPASRFEEVAQGAAQLLRYDLITGPRLAQLLDEEFGGAAIPDRAWRPAVASIVARLAKAHHLVAAFEGAESLLTPMALLLRAGIVAAEARRAGNVMLDRRLERPEARAELSRMDEEWRRRRKARFGRSAPLPQSFDITLNAENMDAGQMAEVLR